MAYAARRERSGSDPVRYEIKAHLGVLSTSGTGWTREVNIVSWNDRQARLDIRDWDPDHVKMSRGVGLNGDEVMNLRSILENLDPDTHQI